MRVAGPSAVVAAGSAFISGQTFSPTVAGTYTVTVTDEDASPAACPVVRTIDIAACLTTSLYYKCSRCYL